MAQKGFTPQINLLGTMPQGKESILVDNHHFTYETMENPESFDLSLLNTVKEANYIYSNMQQEEYGLPEEEADLSIEFYDMNGISVLRSPQILQLSESSPIELPIASEFFDMAFESERNITIQAPGSVMFSEGYRDSAGLWHVAYDQLLDLSFHYHGEIKNFEIEMTTNCETENGAMQSMSHIIMVNIDEANFITHSNASYSIDLTEYTGHTSYNIIAKK